MLVLGITDMAHNFFPIDMTKAVQEVLKYVNKDQVLK